MKCWNCVKTIIGPKIVVNVNGMAAYWCKECVYYKDMGLQNPDTPEKRP